MQIIRKNIKNLTLRVNTEGEIVVTAPLKMSESYILDFVQSKQKWIDKRLAKCKKVDDDKFLYLGKLYDKSELNEDLYSFYYKKAEVLFRELIDNLKLKEHLIRLPRDYVGALKQLPSRLLKLYLHAYQSYLWNETLAKYLIQFNGKEVPYSLGKFVFVDQKSSLEVPLIGFDTEFDNDNIGNIAVGLLEKEGVDFSDFVIKQIPNLSREGELRKAFVDVNNFEFGSVEDDDLNFGKKKVKVSFTLGKGSYATIVIKKLFA